MKKNKYYLCKEQTYNGTIKLTYKDEEGYNVSPKVRGKGAIDVDKLIFISPDFSEKVIRRKIEYKINLLLKKLEYMDENGDDEGAIEKSLIEAEKLRIKIINMYVKYLGHTYEKLTLKKIQIIIDNLKYRLMEIDKKKEEEIYLNYNEEKRGKGR